MDLHLVSVNRQQILLEPINPNSYLWLKGDITINNTSESKVVYKIQGTNSSHYISNPNAGSLEPGDVKVIQIELQGPYLIQAQEKKQNFAHRFLLSVMKMPEDGNGERLWKDAKEESIQRVRFFTTLGPTAINWEEVHHHVQNPQTRGNFGLHEGLRIVTILTIVLGIVLAYKKAFSSSA